MNVALRLKHENEVERLAGREIRISWECVKET